ncbi:MAG: 23S rRNA (pseudouridine(1915)-N(3))-methyltransferase RlmH [bacterium]
MRYNIIAVGKVREKYLQRGIAEYAKRLSAYGRVTFTEIPDESIPDHASAKEEIAVLEKEGERILRQLKLGKFTIALAIEGEAMTSEAFAAYLADLGIQGRSDVNFIIGGSLGLAPAVLAAADIRLSFSHFTFPHQMMRLILLEQLYRAHKIIQGETYHK